MLACWPPTPQEPPGRYTDLHVKMAGSARIPAESRPCHACRLQRTRTSCRPNGLQLLLLSNILLFVVFANTGEAGYLFRASPGGDGVKPAGLWGGQINHSDNGQADNLFQRGYDEVALPSAFKDENGLIIRRTSFDPVSWTVLVEVEDITNARTIVAEAAICPIYVSFSDDGSPIPLQTVIPEVRLVDINHPFLMECGWKCGWAAFTLYGGKVYFVLSALFGQSSSSLRREIQVRVLYQGYKQILQNISQKAGPGVDDFDVLQYSHHVATAHAHGYAIGDEITTWLSSSLQLVQSSLDSTWYFYLQLMKKEGSKVTMNLVQVKQNDTSGKMVYSEQVPSEYGGNTRIRGFGELDYNDGMLCWTAAETLICAPVEGSELSIKSVIVGPGDAQNKGICKTEPMLPLGPVLTGVSVATSSPLRVYFGCYSQQAGLGGVGLAVVTIRSTPQSIAMDMFPVTSNRRKVFGGSLFYVDALCVPCRHDCPDVKPTTEKPLTFPPPTGGVIGGQQSTWASIRKMLFLVFWVMIALM